MISNANATRTRYLIWAAGIACLLAGGAFIAFQYRETESPADRLLAELGDLTPDADTIMSLTEHEPLMAVARTIYLDQCMRCHGMQAQGMSGPNLTDDYYVNVVRVEDLYDIIANGRNHNAMPAWKYSLTRNQMLVLSAYVASLRGQNRPGQPPDPRAVQIAPWPSTYKSFDLPSQPIR